jgi:hypothetical protein
LIVCIILQQEYSTEWRHCSPFTTPAKTPGILFLKKITCWQSHLYSSHPTLWKGILLI